MKVDLRELKPNPMRDFTVDPLDDDRIAELTKSIGEDGFWGGIVCRRIPDGTIQIGAGHHLVAAAIAAGVTIADVFVSEDMDDATMVRVYARENATQRGNVGTAQVGSVASAVKFVAKSALAGGTSEEVFGRSLITIRGQLGSKKGIGRNVVVKFLNGVPSINDGTVQHALANIKASGDYARIIREVQGEIERENKASIEALERAEREQDEEAVKGFDALRKARDTTAKAVESANGKPITFDFEGVAKHLKNPHQVDVSRQQVTGQGIAPYLPVNKQAALAEHLVKLAGEYKTELTGSFIKGNLYVLVMGVKDEERARSKKERERILRESIVARAKSYQGEFAAACRKQAVTGFRLEKLWEDCPKGLTIPITGEFREGVDMAIEMLTSLRAKMLWPPGYLMTSQ